MVYLRNAKINNMLRIKKLLSIHVPLQKHLNYEYTIMPTYLPAYLQNNSKEINVFFLLFINLMRMVN